MNVHESAGSMNLYQAFILFCPTNILDENSGQNAKCMQLNFMTICLKSYNKDGQYNEYLKY